ncbi:MAG: choice-of-anchor B family protein [Saprospiraceae bacterium]|nr:MAG: choice-of-anchor B family protein [Saprospiraceae bacterium]
MNKITRITAICLLAFSSIFGQGTEATFLGNWHDDNIVIVPWLNGRYNEVWGFAQGGHEYGVIGSTAGIHFIDVTNPTNPQQAFLVPGSTTGSGLVHRDFKDFNGYLYAVQDEGFSTATLQIIDLQDLPNSVTQVYSSNEFVQTSHNLYIDTSQARLYLLGASSQTKVLDISNPAQPVLLATYPNSTLNLPYTHDAFIKDNIGYMNCGNSGLWVVDFTDPAAPILLGTMTSYPGAGYNHSGWLSEDGNYYFLCDETHGSPIKTVDISDFGNLHVVASMDASSSTTQIPHNCIIRGNLLYASYYYDGLQVFDVSNPLNPVRVAYYDTYAGPDESFYAGAWGVNPNLPSGNILISDIQSGLWVFGSLDQPQDLAIVPSQTEFNTCTGEPITFDLTIGNDFAGSGATLDVPGLPATANVVYSANPAMPGSAVTLTITGYPSTLGAIDEMIITASDDVNTSSASVFLAVAGQPEAPALSLPADNATEVVLQPVFVWGVALDAASYKLEVSTDAASFDDHIVYSATTTNTTFTPTVALAEGTAYYWRVKARNNCYSTYSAVRTFKTEGVNATGELAGNRLAIYPNPANGMLFIQFEQPLPEAFQVQLLSPSGQTLQQHKMLAGANGISLNMAATPAGIYWLKLASAENTLVRKIVVQR